MSTSKYKIKKYYLVSRGLQLNWEHSLWDNSLKNKDKKKYTEKRCSSIKVVNTPPLASLFIYQVHGIGVQIYKTLKTIYSEKYITV